MFTLKKRKTQLMYMGANFYFVLKKRKKQPHVWRLILKIALCLRLFFKNSTKVTVFSVFLCLLKKECAHTPNYYTTDSPHPDPASCGNQSLELR